MGNSDYRHAVVVMADCAPGDVIDRNQRRWLGRGRLAREVETTIALNHVLTILGHEPKTEGLAGLRFWGQTSDRSSAWMAAADPVYLEPTRNDCRIHALDRTDIEPADLQTAVDLLQDKLGTGSRSGNTGFARIGACGYLRSDEPLATADFSAKHADGGLASDFIPEGEGTERYHQLLSEIQMTLHESPFNAGRESRGLYPINSLWLWGGGIAPNRCARPIPPLFAGDPLFCGFWESCTGVLESWPGSIEACLEIAVADFVAVPSSTRGESRDELCADVIASVRKLVGRGQIYRATLVFSGGISVTLGRLDALKVWRRNECFPGQVA